MLDANWIAENEAVVKANLDKRCADETMYNDVDRVVELSSLRKELVGERDELRNQRNRLSKEIGQLYKAGKRDDAEEMKATVSAGNERISVIEEQIKGVEEERLQLCLGLPNLLHEAVPKGKSEDFNILVRTHGERPKGKPEGDSHVEIGERLDILDFERAAKISGTRFAVLKGAGARLERALINYFLDMHTERHGYTEVLAPYIVQRHAAVGTTQLPKFEEDMFKLQGQLNGSDAYLIPTAEVPITNLHREEIVDFDKMPIKYCAFSPCFRSEAGSAGRDVRGLIRTHQFHKVELVQVCPPEIGEDCHHELLTHAETPLKELGLKYRVMELCGGDTSFGAHRCFDLEVWLPSQGYREISSVSHFGDYQARRMSLRYRPQPVNGKKQKPRIAHTINGSGLAVGRTVVAILENYVQPDGSVVVPEVLRGYMGGLERITAPSS